MMFENETNVLDLPNQYINFEGAFAVSSGLPNAEALLFYLELYLNKWVESQDSVHQFATKYADEGISLWTASDVPLREEDIAKQRTCFYLVSTKNEQGYVLIHCQLSYKEALQ
ncbi:hemophilus-specific protein [Avibacterium paragallinarum]|nr:hemophilus-specific protein [Avibacterium paragallinarum]MEE3608205.1 hemophilus-specific protein [Avibacterium paragallinarum]MEE3621123.1 hemophilus-specific protein [Avibacterium paragallinarum]MEE3668354.1 hemophilus-specific protein [Avibacterium paragallinarum]MEE3680364.1 hemophilus-specific protein [Avibacterium paragallinarum]MEE4385977.1 hemophilus-specific protein [Avibacterium paragallinarum]